MTVFMLGNGQHRGFDGNDTNTVSLLHFDTNTGHPALYDDNGANIARTWSGATSIATDTPVFGNGYMNFASQLLSTTPDSALQIAGSNFTVDFWMKTSDAGVNRTPYVFNFMFNDAGVNTPSFSFYVVGNSTVSPVALRWRGQVDYNGTQVTTTTTVTDGAWRHYAIVASGGTIYLFMNGVLQGTMAKSAVVPTYTLLYLNFDGVNSGSQFLNGGMDEFRISNVARWTANFSPPTRIYS